MKLGTAQASKPEQFRWHKKTVISPCCIASTEDKPALVRC
jgi:hypothetical protein